MATLLITSAGFEGHVIKLKLGTNRIGRGPENDFQIDHPTISAGHCEIDVQSDALMLRDCDSTNGTFIDGQPVVAAKLLSGRAFRLGEVELLVESTEIPVYIPRFQVAPEAQPPVVLEDGSLICPRHPRNRSTYRCIHCKEVMCDGCVRRIARRGGKVHRLCPKCSHHLEQLGGEKKKKRSLLELLKKTIGIGISLAE